MDEEKVCKAIFDLLVFPSTSRFLATKEPAESQKVNEKLKYELYRIQKVFLERRLVSKEKKQFRIELTSLIVSNLPQDLVDNSPIIYNEKYREDLGIIKELLEKYPLLLDMSDIKRVGKIYSRGDCALQREDVDLLLSTYRSFENDDPPKYLSDASEKNLSVVANIFSNNERLDLAKYYGKDEISSLNKLVGLIETIKSEGEYLKEILNLVPDILEEIRISLEKTQDTLIPSRALSNIIFQFVYDSELSNEVSSVLNDVIEMNDPFNNIYSIVVKCKSCGYEGNILSSTTQRASNDESQYSITKCSNCASKITV